MKLLEMYIDNVRGIQTAHITFPPDGLVQINGGNETGKTTLLKCIAWPLMGKRNRPDWDTVVREGEKKGEIKMVIGDSDAIPEYELTLIFRKGGELLTLTRLDGSPLGDGAQAILNKFWNDISLRPEKFAFMDMKEQRQLLLKAYPPPVTDAYVSLVGRKPNDDEDPVKLLDAKIKHVSEVERRDLNRDIKQIEAQLVEYRDVPDNLARTDIGAETSRRQTLQLQLSSIEAFEFKYDEKMKRIEMLEQELAQLQTETTDMIIARPEGEATDLRSQIEDIDQLIRNSVIADKSEKKARLMENLAAFKSDAETKSALLDDLAAHKVWMIENSELPGPLGFHEDDGLTYEGQLIEQRGDSRGILAGIEVGAALNPQLKVVLVNSGGEIDDATMKLITDRAHELEMLVVMVRQIPSNPDQVNFVIEDGIVVEG